METTPHTHSLPQALRQLQFITPKGVLRWCRALCSEGTTLMALVRFAAETYPQQIALLDAQTPITYRELWHKSQQLAHLLHSAYSLYAGKRVGILCRNHTLAVLLLPALSRLGVHTHLLNTEMGAEKIDGLLHTQRKRYDLLIVDQNLQETCLPQACSTPFITSEELSRRLEQEVISSKKLPHVHRGGELTVLTGGSGGDYKAASRHPSATQFLPPLLALLRQIGIHRYRSVYIALPLYHGFGLATLITSLVMGKSILLTRHFDTDEALRAIHHFRIEAAPLVPVMLSRMLQKPKAQQLLSSLKCIICGGDRLERKLIEQTHQSLGKIVYNLYGTSEAGFFLLATPDDLDRHTEETTLGRPIRGVNCCLRDVNSEGIGTLWVRSGWAMQGRNNRWQSTGDLMRCSAEGYYFHQGRADLMIVSGGENVYPEVVERIIAAHPEVFTAKVYPISHPSFGQVLAARVECHNTETPLSEEELRSWLRPRLARAEMPHHITFGSVEVLETGKRR